MELQTVSLFVTNVGFPVFVSYFLLTKFSKVVENNTKAITQMQIQLQELQKKYKRGVA